MIFRNKVRTGGDAILRFGCVSGQVRADTTFEIPGGMRRGTFETVQAETDRGDAARRLDSSSLSGDTGGFGAPRVVARGRDPGEVAEWLKAPHSKCGLRATAAGVRIPPSPVLLACPPQTLEYQGLMAFLHADAPNPAASRHRRVIADHAPWPLPRTHRKKQIRVASHDDPDSREREQIVDRARRADRRRGCGSVCSLQSLHPFGRVRLAFCCTSR